MPENLVSFSSSLFSLNIDSDKLAFFNDSVVNVNLCIGISMLNLDVAARFIVPDDKGLINQTTTISKFKCKKSS